MQVTSEAAAVLWMLAEGVTLLGQIILLITTIPVARISAFFLSKFLKLQFPQGMAKMAR